ncbi:ABC transporter substrate-binding protein [Kutzneria chonburiensis]|uniref:ABC transporter substrate-binding protein n=1 Tax=Kutzneria chonburiensis TaxID=1483604 RepID=A0ABV6MMM4_9PSEU|nr:hypothetical protein [Kutzneria chonburiensis]
MRTIRLGTFSPSVLLDVAAEALAAAGLTVVESPATSSAQQFTDLFTGRLDAAFTNPDNVLAYRLVPDNPLGRTGDVRILGAIDRGLGLGLFTGPAGLRRSLGVDVAGSGFAFIGYELLARTGLLRDVDYQVSPLGSTPRRARALIAGEIDCTVLNAGNDLVAEEQGAVRVASVTEIGPYVGTVLAATADSLARNGDALSTLLDVIAATVETIRSHPAVATAAITQRLGLTGPTAARHLAVLTDPLQGLISGGTLDQDDLRTIVSLRNRHARSTTTLTVADTLASGLLNPG